MLELMLKLKPRILKRSLKRSLNKSSYLLHFSLNQIFAILRLHKSFHLLHDILYKINSTLCKVKRNFKESLKKSFYKLKGGLYHLSHLSSQFKGFVHKLNKSFCAANNRLYKLKSQNGFLDVISLAIGIVLIIIVSLAIFLIILVGNGSQNAEEDVPATVKNNDTNNVVKNNDTNQVYKPEQGEDLTLGYLVCVNLPGIKAGRTPALDVRVARRYLAVKQDLDAQGVPTVNFSWGLRTTCQQVNVKPSGHNPKNAPGTSPHEAGRALDVVGLDPSSGAFRKNDWFKITATFKAHGWRWLAQKDPPHMDIDCSLVGERSNLIWIQKTQLDYQRGNPKGGCRGPECAP